MPKEDEKKGVPPTESKEAKTEVVATAQIKASQEPKVTVVGIPWKGKILTKDSPYLEILQYIFDEFYLRPYEGRPSSSGTIARPWHGAVHASSAAVVGLGFAIHLARRYLPETIVSPLNLKDHVHNHLISFLVVILHDHKNTQEIFQDEEKQAESAKTILLALGFAAEEVTPWIEALRDKDKPCRSLPQALVHDADFWEYLRVILATPYVFDLRRSYVLELIKRYNPHFFLAAASEMHTIQQYYYAYLNSIYTNPILHSNFENDSNIGGCYLLVRKHAQGLWLRNKCSWLFTGLPSPYIAPIEKKLFQNVIAPQFFYDISTDSSTCLKHLLNLSTEEKKIHPEEGEGFLRIIDADTINFTVSIEKICQESEVLDTNDELIKRLKITSTNIENFYSDEAKSEQKAAVASARLRPASSLLPHIPFVPYCNGKSVALFLIFKPSTLTAARYKRSSYSHCLASGTFIYKRSRGTGAKKKSSEELREKRILQDQRRLGLAYDDGYMQWGKPQLPFDEHLLLPCIDDVIGIGIYINTTEPKVTDVMAAAKLALCFALGWSNQLHFYSFGRDGLHCLSVEDMLTLSVSSLTESTQRDILKQTQIHDLLKEDYSGKIHLPHIKDLTCSLEYATPPSLSSPVEYTFQLEYFETHRYSIFMSALGSTPTIKIRKTFSLRTNEFVLCNFSLPQLAMEYNKRVLDIYNREYKPLVNIWLQRHQAISCLDISLQEIKRELSTCNKKALYLTYRSATEVPLTMPFPRACKSFCVTATL